MRINVISDLHLEFGGLTLPGGDVLIISGDACEARKLNSEFHSTRPVPYTGGNFACYDFFEFECRKYNKVFFVMGNHEHYGSQIQKSADIFKQCVPSNVTLLEKEKFEYEGVLFLGGTLWTDMNNLDSLTLYHMKTMMNDYRQIKMFNAVKNVYHKLTPEFTVEEHVKTKQLFKLFLEENRAGKNLPVVVLTHHAPSKLSTHPHYANDTIMNGAYSSDLSEFILDNPEIKLWTHGHTHDPFDYMIGDTRIICNPRGYKGYETRANNFDTTLGVDI